MIPAELEKQVNHIKKVSTDEYSSSCPKCGGSVHTDGALPDRFRIFLRSKTTGDVMGWCRQCSYTWFPDASTTGLEPGPTQEIIEKRKAAARKMEQDQIDTFLQNIERLQKDAPWVAYQKDLQGEPAALDMFHDRGIDEEFWFEYWQLGYCPRKAYSFQGKLHYSPSLTIPLMASVTREVFNIRHRLLAPVDPGDKYRPDRKGLPSGLFLCDLDRPLEGKCLIVEGEFKAMTTYLKIQDPDLHVVGIPGKKPHERMLRKLDKCDPVYICMDPDAYFSSNGSITAIERLIQIINARGKGRARVMQVPGKIDDLISDGYLGEIELRALLKTARVRI